MEALHNLPVGDGSLPNTRTKTRVLSKYIAEARCRVLNNSY